MGTAIVGALIITLLTVFRFLVQMLASRMRNKCSIFYCLAIFLKKRLDILNKWIKCLNRNAYIVCALHGTGFFESAKYAVNILLRNGVSALAVIGISKLVIFMSKLLVTLLVGLVTYWILYSSNDTANSNELAIFATVILSVLTYYGASIFFTVHLVAIETIFLCYLEDYERNDGTKERPYFMPKSLMQIIQIKKPKDELTEGLI